MSILRKIVEKKKSEKYAWPAGWLTREQAANDLGVSPRDVDDTLKEAIRDGDVLKQHFPLWDASQGRVIRQPGYRVAEKTPLAPAKNPVPQDPDFSKERRIRTAIQKYPDRTNREIAKNLSGVTSADVQAVRDSLNP